MTPADSGLVIQCVRRERDGLLTPVVPRLGTWIYAIVVVTSRWLSSSQTVRRSWLALRRFTPFVLKLTIARGRWSEQAYRAVSDERQAVVRLAQRRVE